MYHIDHVRKFLGTRRKQFRGRKDHILNQAIAASQNRHWLLDQDDLDQILGQSEAALLARWAMTKPAYLRVSAQVEIARHRAAKTL